MSRQAFDLSWNREFELTLEDWYEKHVNEEPDCDCGFKGHKVPLKSHYDWCAYATFMIKNGATHE